LQSKFCIKEREIEQLCGVLSVFRISLLDWHRAPVSHVAYNTRRDPGNDRKIGHIASDDGARANQSLPSNGHPGKDRAIASQRRPLSDSSFSSRFQSASV
jgi:hypothetical protein